jgi:GTPase KRas protein
MYSTTFPNVSEYKIVVLGAGGVGKSALTIRLVTENFLDEYDPTIEDSYRKQITVDNKPALLDILDTAGQEEFSSMQDQWMREGDGFLLVYSIASRNSFEEMQHLREKIWRNQDGDDDNFIPIVIAGNKCDLINQRQVEYSDLQSLGKLWNCSIYETSAKAKINNTEIFHEVVRLIDNKRNGLYTDEEEVEKKKKLKCVIL